MKMLDKHLFTLAPKDYRCAYIASPFAATVMVSQVEHRDYLLRCLRDSITHGESPYAPHAYLPLTLNDEEPLERVLGINCGLAWMRNADHLVLYMDYGLSPGMEGEKNVAEMLGIPIHERYIGRNSK